MRMSPIGEPRVLPVLLPGDTIDRFRLTAKLGEGATSVVFAAHAEHAVALKILQRTHDETLRKRFLREARIASMVKHRNVAEVFEVVDTPACSLIVMELVRGRTLRAQLNEAARAGAALEREETLRIAQRLCRGVAAAHRAEIVHGDLKPENVMLGEHGGVKLLDF